jgi:hypothetical protein
VTSRPIADRLAHIDTLRGWPIALYVIFTLLLTIGVSGAVFRAVELRATKLGKRLAGRRAIDVGTQAAP